MVKGKMAKGKNEESEKWGNPYQGETDNTTLERAKRGYKENSDKNSH